MFCTNKSDGRVHVPVSDRGRGDCQDTALDVAAVRVRWGEFDADQERTYRKVFRDHKIKAGSLSAIEGLLLEDPDNREHQGTP